ncbi:MAG: hypothetical protein IPP64_06150 [Bacteroidetes bacterium]|nr:hypothetical protein [Bacteroidota bacterium]
MPSPYIEDLLSNLNLSEKKSISHFFSNKGNSDELLVRKYIEVSTIPNSEPINKKINYTLKSRAFESITDILTSNYHIQNKENFASHDQILLRLKKKILLARILSKNLNQGKTAPFKTILNSIITEAEKNEVYEVLIEALLLKKYYFALKEGVHQFQKLDEKISYYEMCQKRAYFANDCYFKIIFNNNLLKIKNDRLFHNYILRSIRQLKLDYQKYKSQQINYYLHIILMYYFEKQKKYVLSAKYCKLLLNIVKNSPIVYREERLGNILINLSQYRTFTENYNEAVKYAKESQKHYLENSNNYLTSKDQEFTIYFYHKKYEKATECMKELLTHKLIDSGQFNRAKYIYYQSALLFAQKQYKQSYALLNKSLEIEKDKSRWNISLRITNIMLCIELNKINEASRLLESLRKYVERHEKTSEIKQRDLLIVRTLRELEKDGFNYDIKNKEVTKMIKILSQKDKPTSWEHYSPELIPFHEWLEGKK